MCLLYCYKHYRMAQKIATVKHFGRQNIGGLAALHSKIAKIHVKGLADKTLAKCQFRQCFVLYSIRIGTQSQYFCQVCIRF